MNRWRAGWWWGCTFLLGGLPGWAGPDAALKIAAPAFATGKAIPAIYALKSGDVSPELRFANIPANASSLVLIVDDPDAPSGLWTHWLVWNLAAASSLPRGRVPPGAVQGKNSFGEVHYDGPAPPSGTHRYFFHLYALDTRLSLPPGADRAALMKAMNGHIVGTGETFGVYTASP